MGGWHPQQVDGGIPPNENAPLNPAQAFDPETTPIDTSALYFGNGCDVRLRPHVINSLISENLAVVDRVGLGYQAAKLTNLRIAIEYIVQRGLPKFSIIDDEGTPNHYRGVMDPPCHEYNDGQVALVLPKQTNRGFVRIDLGPGGWTPVLRNDLQELRAEDWLENVPELIGYWDGNWYMLGLCKSQVPLILTGTMEFWIRTDGNDITGDGVLNSADRAFRTINGCWAAVGSRYAGSPGAHIAMKLGIPGSYEWGSVGPYGAAVSLTGDVNNRAGYRIVMDPGAPHYCRALAISGCNSFYLRGVNLIMNNPGPKVAGTLCLDITGSKNCALDRVQFTCETSNPAAGIIGIAHGSTMGAGADWGIGSDILIMGNGQTIGTGIGLAFSSVMNGTGLGVPPTLWNWSGIHFTQAGYSVGDGSTLAIQNSVVTNGGTGPRYLCTDHSTIRAYGTQVPGDQPGSLGAFSSFFA